MSQVEKEIGRVVSLLTYHPRNIVDGLTIVREERGRNDEGLKPSGEPKVRVSGQVLHGDTRSDT